MRILVICDSPYLFTGLARVNKNVIDGLKRNGHEVFIGAWGWDQLAYPLNDENKWVYKDDSGFEYVVFPISKDPKKMLIQTYEILKSIPCDILLTIGDYWSFKGFELLKSKLDYSFKWMTYYTIESCPINEEFFQSFHYMDEIMVPSLFGQRVIHDSVGLSSHYVPYGIDHSVFYRIDEFEIDDAKKRRDLEGKIRFINVSKNQNRKNIPAFLEAIKLANEKDNRIVGYIHTNVDKKVQSQVNILNIIKRLGIENIMSIPNHKISLDIGCSDDKLRTEYCCSDALVLSSVAEGFGLPILEAQSCGIPAIVTDCSSMSELCFNKELLVKNMEYYGPMEQKVGIIDVHDLVEKIFKVIDNNYSNEKTIEFSKGFIWNTTNKKIQDIINNMNDKINIPVESI